MTSLKYIMIIAFSLIFVGLGVFYYGAEYPFFNNVSITNFVFVFLLAVGLFFVIEQLK